MKNLVFNCMIGIVLLVSCSIFAVDSRWNGEFGIGINVNGAANSKIYAEVALDLTNVPQPYKSILQGNATSPIVSVPVVKPEGSYYNYTDNYSVVKNIRGLKKEDVSVPTTIKINGHTVYSSYITLLMIYGQVKPEDPRVYFCDRYYFDNKSDVITWKDNTTNSTYVMSLQGAQVITPGRANHAVFCINILKDPPQIRASVSEDILKGLKSGSYATFCFPKQFLFSDIKLGTTPVTISFNKLALPVSSSPTKQWPGLAIHSHGSGFWYQAVSPEGLPLHVELKKLIGKTLTVQFVKLYKSYGTVVTNIAGPSVQQSGNESESLSNTSTDL